MTWLRVNTDDPMDVLPFVLASMADHYDFDTALTALLGCAMARIQVEEALHKPSEQMAYVQRFLMERRADLKEKT